MTERIALLEAARRAFARDGYEATTVRAIAEEAGVPLARLHAEFPAKTSFGLSIYRELLHEVEEAIGELPDAGVGARFAALVNFKLTRLDAHRPALLALVAAALDPAGPLGVLSDATAAIRSRMHGLVRVAVVGANDVTPAQGPALARTLYSLHLAIVLAWTQDPAGARALTALAAELLTAGAPMLPLADAHLQRFDAAFSPHLGSDDRAHTLLERLFRHRRVLPGVPAPDDAAFAPTSRWSRPRSPAARRSRWCCRRSLQKHPTHARCSAPCPTWPRSSPCAPCEPSSRSSQRPTR